MILFLTELTVGQLAEVGVPLITLKIKQYYDDQEELELLEKAGESSVSESGSGLGAGSGISLDLDLTKVGVNPVAGLKSDDIVVSEEEVINGGDRGKNKKGKDETNKPKGAVNPHNLSHLVTPEDREGRDRRLAAMEEQKKERTFEWIQEQNEDEANKEQYWTSGGTLFDYQEMAIQFGYVCLFSMAFPVCPFIAWINNCIELRTDSFKLNATMQRPSYRVLGGIGMWSDVLYYMVLQAIFVNMLMIVIVDHASDDVTLFNTSNAEATTLVLIVAEHVIVGLKIVIEQMIPDTTVFLEEAMDGYEYLRDKAMADSGEEAVRANEDLENLRNKILQAVGGVTRDINDRHAQVGMLKKQA